jgi:LmbE family N-acetylglucosaminyl deacetylase
MTLSCRTENNGACRSVAPAEPPLPMAVVVAHPDDECLWLSSAVASADRIVFCFGDPFEKPRMSAARRQAIAALPLTRLVDLKLPESGARFSANWAEPQPTLAGIMITDEAARARYEANYPKLVAALRTVLAGCGDVYTHNPWGEYGHTEHIQIYRAVAVLQAELGYTIWFSNYVGARSWKLAQQLGTQSCWTQRRIVRPDLAMAHRLMRVYRRHGAWTWTRWHRWPAHETVYAQPPTKNPTAWHTLSGEWLLDVAGLRWWPPRWNAARKRLG